MRRCDYYNCLERVDEDSEGFVFCTNHTDYIDDLMTVDKTGIDALRYYLSSINTKADFGQLRVL